MEALKRLLVHMHTHREHTSTPPEETHRRYCAPSCSAENLMIITGRKHHARCGGRIQGRGASPPPLRIPEKC